MPAIALIAAMLLRLRVGRITPHGTPDWTRTGVLRPSSACTKDGRRTKNARIPYGSRRNSDRCQKSPGRSTISRPSQTLTSPQRVRYSTPMATRWSDEQRTHALDQLATMTLAEVARDTGIPKRTISDWARAEGIETSTPQARAKTARARETLEAVTAEKRANLAAGLMADAQRLRTQLFAPTVEKRAMAIAIGGDMGQGIEVAEVELDRPTPTDQVKIMTAVAIAVDKIQLLTGEATERHEHTAPNRTPEQEQELAKVLTLVQGAA